MASPPNPLELCEILPGKAAPCVHVAKNRGSGRREPRVGDIWQGWRVLFILYGTRLNTGKLRTGTPWHGNSIGAENSRAVSRPPQVTAEKLGRLSRGRGRWAGGVPGLSMQGHAPGAFGRGGWAHPSFPGGRPSERQAAPAGGPLGVQGERGGGGAAVRVGLSAT